MRKAERIALEARMALLDKEKAFAGKIMSYYMGAEQALRGDLNLVRSRLESAIASGKSITAANILNEETHVTKMLEAIEKEMQGFSRLVMGDTRKRAVDAAKTGVEAAISQVGIVADLDTLPTESLRNLVERYDREPLSRKYGLMGLEAKQRARQAMFSGVAAGKNPREMVGDVAQSLQATRTDAEVIARTTVISAHRDAGIEAYRLSGIVKQYERLATLSPRTCPVCLALDHRRFDISEPFWRHPQCRCTHTAVLEDSEVDLVGEPTEPGSKWFERQDKLTRERMLGPTKNKLYESGVITLDDLVEVINDPDYGPTIRERSIRSLIREGIITKEQFNAAYLEGMGYGKKPEISLGNDVTQAENDQLQVIRAMGQVENKEFLVAMSKDGETKVFDTDYKGLSASNLPIALKNHLKDETFTVDEIEGFGKSPSLKKVHVILPNGDIHTMKGDIAGNHKKINSDASRRC
jgi:SPP1 gp7 family putative phage head morphogenesis protein